MEFRVKGFVAHAGGFELRLVWGGRFTGSRVEGLMKTASCCTNPLVTLGLNRSAAVSPILKKNRF